MTTFADVLAHFHATACGITTAYGTAFEILVKNILLHAPVYRGQFKHVWLWNELNWGHDSGIDLVAVDEFNNLIGIQAKCYDPQYQVSKDDINTFIATLNKAFPYQGTPTFFTKGMIFSTTNKWSSTAIETLQGQKTPCQLISRALMETWEVDWDVLSGSKVGAVVAEKELRDYQIEALAAAQRHYATYDRGKLIMACGTGKTLTSLRILEQQTEGKGLALFLVPSIALLNQTLIAWSEDAHVPIHAICVCSDIKANRKANQDEDAPEENPNSLALPPTTYAPEIARRIRYYRERFPNDLTIVFSTYQSIAMVEEAQRQLGRESFIFNYAICDEAHRTTGVIDTKTKSEPAFTYIHSDDHILTQKRLYMTATPRLYRASDKVKAQEKDLILCSMDDPETYGEEFYHIGFGTAVEKGCLSDYKVFVLTIPEHDCDGVELYDTLDAAERKALESKDDDGRNTPIKLMGCINALAKHLTDSALLDEHDRIPARRAVAFCRTIASSKAITKLFNKFANDERYNRDLRVEAQHVDGSMSALERNNHIAWLKADGTSSDCHLLTNVRCLSEGVDVPSLDAALFLSKRNSEIDVVQSVGRVMRRAPGKRFGYIIIPVVIPEGKDPAQELANSDTFGVVWTVLNALRSHDDRFESEINKLRFKNSESDSVGRIIIDTGMPNNGGGSDGDTAIQDEFDLRFPLQMEKYRTLLYGRIVEKCGDRLYFQRWAADVAAIAERHIAQLKRLCAEDVRARDAFNRYYAFLQTAVYTTVSEEDARVMLAQQRITAPIFDALFGDNRFTQHNPVSEAIDHATDLLLRLESEEDRLKLNRFYESVRRRVEGIQSADAKLEIIRTLYDTFFAVAFKRTAEKLGIVFTPIEVVDFILRSADGALRKHFGKRLSDEGVNILDPFTGTGTFIARLLQKDVELIRQEDLYRKYTRELHANEIVLLSYYIAAINIENVFHDRQGRKEKYTAFPGIILGDTFRMLEVKPEDTLDDGVFMANSERILTQNKTPISVIVGNPPYSVSKGESYPTLDKRIESTYVSGSSATNKNSLYDSYIKAFRWSSDRLDAATGGVLCYVTNGGWLDSNAAAGFRKCLQAEFDEIYCYNLRGNQLTQGELSRKEGGKIFDSGCRCPITILCLVRLPASEHHGNATIHYRDIGDYKDRDEKLHTLDLEASFFNPTWVDTEITPNAHGDWINQRNDAFSSFIPIESKKKFDTKSQSVFVVNSRGYETAKDPWMYNFSTNEVQTNSSSLKSDYRPPISVYQPAIYRPFVKEWLCKDKILTHRCGQWFEFFPTGKAGENLVICTGGLGSTKERTCLIVNMTPDLNMLDAGTQCFPLYWYEEKDADLFGNKTLVRHDGISDFILKEARNRYRTATITKEDIFYYVYGFLHQADYRTTFAADLKKTLPRLPLVERFEEFKAFSDAGRQLATLHLNYETLEPYPLTEVGDFFDKRIEKMSFPKKDKTRVLVNGTLMLEGIPLEAHDYVVNGRSPIEWVLDRYQVKTDKVSGITNDPNLWAPENPRYIPDLIKRLVTLSLESLRIIKTLPKITF